MTMKMQGGQPLFSILLPSVSGAPPQSSHPEHSAPDACDTSSVMLTAPKGLESDVVKEATDDFDGFDGITIKKEEEGNDELQFFAGGGGGENRGDDQVLYLKCTGSLCSGKWCSKAGPQWPYCMTGRSHTQYSQLVHGILYRITSSVSLVWNMEPHHTCTWGCNLHKPWFLGFDLVLYLVGICRWMKKSQQEKTPSLGRSITLVMFNVRPLELVQLSCSLYL